MLSIPVAFLAFTQAIPTKGSTKASLTNKKKPCLQDCGTTEYKPVCGGDGVGKNMSFGSACVLGNYNCENSKSMYYPLDLGIQIEVNHAKVYLKFHL